MWVLRLFCLRTANPILFEKKLDSLKLFVFLGDSLVFCRIAVVWNEKKIRQQDIRLNSFSSFDILQWRVLLFNQSNIIPDIRHDKILQSLLAEMWRITYYQNMLKNKPKAAARCKWFRNKRISFSERWRYMLKGRAFDSYRWLGCRLELYHYTSLQMSSSSPKVHFQHKKKHDKPKSYHRQLR